MKIYENRIKHEEFIGKVIGKVIITSFSHSVAKKGRYWYYYNYQCECGNQESAVKHSLLQSLKRDKNTYCCTTCRKDKSAEWARNACVKYIDPVEAKCAILFSNYRSKCKMKQWDFELTFNQFKDLVTSNCHYCNLEPEKCRLDRAKSRIGISRILFNGIDRINSEIGYKEDNVLPCCEDCNKAKRNLSYDQFLDLIKRIYNFKIKKDE